MVTDEVVEAACRARWDALGSQFTGYNGDVARTWDALVSLFPAQAERARANERVTLAAVLPEIQAQALEEAAQEMRRRDDHFSWDEIHRGSEWLDERAARLRAKTEEATTPVHVGGRVNAEDCPACSPAIDPPPYPWICPGSNETEGPTT